MYFPGNKRKNIKFGKHLVLHPGKDHNSNQNAFETENHRLVLSIHCLPKAPAIYYCFVLVTAFPSKVSLTLCFEVSLNVINRMSVNSFRAGIKSLLPARSRRESIFTFTGGRGTIDSPLISLIILYTSFTVVAIFYLFCI